MIKLNENNRFLDEIKNTRAIYNTHLTKIRLGPFLNFVHGFGQYWQPPLSTNLPVYFCPGVTLRVSLSFPCLRYVIMKSPWLIKTWFTLHMQFCGILVLVYALLQFATAINNTIITWVMEIRKWRYSLLDQFLS